MGPSFYMPFEVFNGILLGVVAIVPITLLVATSRPDWGANRVAQTSRRARLPVGSDAAERSIRTRTRALTRANMWGLLASIAVVASMFALTPLGASPYLLWFAAIAILLGTTTVSAVVVITRERLFSPAPTAPRVARAHALTVRDYLGIWRTLVPTALLAGAAVLFAGVILAAALQAVAPDQIVWVSVTGAVAIAAVAAGRWAERMVLAQPQPASDTLELAWDDLFRADALTTLRMGAALAVWLPFGLALSVLLRAGLPFASTGWGETLGLFPWWGVAAIQVLYTLGLGKLPADLYPDWLRRPASAGGNA